MGSSNNARPPTTWMVRGAAIAVAAVVAIVVATHVRANVVAERITAGDAELLSMARGFCSGDGGVSVDAYPGTQAVTTCDSGPFATEAAAGDFLVRAGFFPNPEPPKVGPAWQVQGDRDGVRVTIFGSEPTAVHLHAVDRRPGLFG